MVNKIFSISIDAKTERIGFKLKENSSIEQVADKINQLVHAYMMGWFSDKEDILTFPQYENKIKKNPLAAAFYSCCFMKKPWPEAEKYIAKNKDASFFYATNVLKSRFPAGEKAISEDPECSLAYCIVILKRKKLPEDMHRKMLSHAIKDPDNKHIKRYLRFKKVS